MVFVSIVGDFHSSILPLFYHFRNDITTHILVYDSFKHDALQAKKLQNGIKKFVKKYNLTIELFTKEIDEDSYGALTHLSNFIQTFITQEQQLLINISDGLANISYGLIKHLEPQGAKFLTYDRFDNTYTSIFDSKMTHPLEVESMNIEDHFLLKNIDILSMQNKEQAHKHEEEINAFFEKQESRDDYSDIIKNSSKGSLYEMYIYNLVKKLSYDDIAMGVKIKDIYTPDISIENEFDILVMKENHLHMIECKFRDYLVNGELSALVYKLDSVGRSIDEDAALMLVSDDDIYDPQIDTIKNISMIPFHRAKTKRIYLRGSPVSKTSRFLRDVDSLFQLDSKNLDEIALLNEPVIVEIDNQKKSINEYFNKLFGKNLNYFNKQDVLKVLNAKVNFPTDKSLLKYMQQKEFRIFFRMINRSKSEADILFIYNYFERYLYKI
ncbi:MAG: DUF1887 family CARF protein [Sulfurimonas sp.]|uniref:Card1-like endonuclease domain-containing protein n=1 Tax=Sulfurimonas sp. TaxID=2022749 RepID=UPI003D0D5253